MSTIHRLSLAGLTSLLLCSTVAFADSVTIPNTFTAHTPAVATQVNANFGAVATAVNGNATDIASLQAAIASMQTTIDTLTAQMAAVQGSSVMALAANLDMVNVPEPSNPAILYPTARFHGINVQIVNGMNDEETTNGVGNLIVGYNPVDASANEFCSHGSYTEEVPCQTNGYIWAANAAVRTT